jgi:hypothetical protein
MERTTASRFDPRAALALIGLVFVVAVVWAASALASGGSSGTPALASGSAGIVERSPFVQDSNGNGAAPSRDDCPEGGGAGGDSGPSDGSGSSGTAL